MQIDEIAWLCFDSKLHNTSHKRHIKTACYSELSTTRKLNVKSAKRQRTEESWRAWEFQYLISPAGRRKCLATSNISLWLSYVGWGALWWMQRRYRVPSQSPLDTELQSWRRYTARCAQPSETKTQPYSESPAVAPGPGTAGTGDEPLYWLVSSRCVWSDE